MVCSFFFLTWVRPRQRVCQLHARLPARRLKHARLFLYADSPATWQPPCIHSHIHGAYAHAFDRRRVREQTDSRRLLELDTWTLNTLLQERSLPLSMQGMEKARNMTEGCVVVVHRSVDGIEAIEATEAIDAIAAIDAPAPSRSAQDTQEAVTAFRGQHHLHLFVSEAQAASLASGLSL